MDNSTIRKKGLVQTRQDSFGNQTILSSCTMFVGKEMNFGKKHPIAVTSRAKLMETERVQRQQNESSKLRNGRTEGCAEGN